MIHIFEHRGVLLEVEYEPTVPHPTFRAVKVVDANYRAIGPNLMPLLHDTLLAREPHGAIGYVMDAQTFLSAIAEDLP